MADITQRLGFDAEGAIGSLRRFATSLSLVNKKLREMNNLTGRRSLSSVSKDIDKIKNSSKGAAAGVNNLERNMKRAGKSGTAAAKSLTVSWETLSRVVLTQVVVRAFSAVIDAISEAADQAIKFEADVVRIAQITEEGSAGVGKLAKTFEDLAVQTGRSLEDITEAGWEALQNDLGTTAETMDLLGGAADNLAKITNSSLVDSANTIASAMKAYGLSISEAADITDTLFVAIDKGRITMEEFASRMGTVEPQAKALGLNLQESSAAVAALTQSGLKGSIAMTQLRNIYNKLIKPTDELAAAFKKIGVDSGPELIRVYGGLRGALLRLNKEAGGNQTVLAKWFNTIRGHLGVLNLLNNDASIFTDILGAMSQRTDRAKEAAEEYNKTRLVKLNQEVERAKRNIRGMSDAWNNVKISFLDYFNTLIEKYNQSAVFERTRIDTLKKMKETAEEALKTSKRAISEEATGLITAIQASKELTAKQKEMYTTAIQARALLQEQTAKLGQQAQFETDRMKLLGDAYKAFIAEAKKSAVDLFETSTSAADINELKALFDETRAEITKGDGASLGMAERILEVLTRRISAMEEEGKLQGEVGQNVLGALNAVNQELASKRKLTEVTAEQVEYQKGLKQLNQEIAAEMGTTVEQLNTMWEAAKELFGTVEAIPESVPAINTSAAISNLKALETQALKTATAVASIGSGGVGAMTAYQGKRVAYRAAGGRGPDQIPAMLAHGESVLNARATRKFFAQTQALNAGGTPASRDQGGSVTNNYDISVNVTGGSGSENPDIAGRRIANSLRRELRRNTSAL